MPTYNTGNHLSLRHFLRRTPVRDRPFCAIVHHPEASVVVEDPRPWGDDPTLAKVDGAYSNMCVFEDTPYESILGPNAQHP